MEAKKIKFSVGTKLLLPIGLIFFFSIVASNWYFVSHQQTDAKEHILSKVDSDARNLFDSLNTMMLGGTIIQNRSIIINKFRNLPNIKEVKILRGSSFIGSSDKPEFKMTDQLDQRGLAGETVVEWTKVNGESMLIYIKPFKASTNYNGINCLMCHQVKEGEVIGAIRISYSMAKEEKAITSSIWGSILISFSILVIGIGLISVLITKIIIQPLCEYRKTIYLVEDNKDLTQRINVNSDDELGRTATVFNSLLAEFQNIIIDVLNASHLLAQSSSGLNTITQATLNEVDAQNTQIEVIREVVGNMSKSSTLVHDNAQQANASAIIAAKDSEKGKLVTQQVALALVNLTSTVHDAADALKILVENSHKITTLLQGIKDIADQTNLLALNAAIEAARAGEQGRGFAVVADEVRSLAQRTQQSTQEIQHIIEQLGINSTTAVNKMQTSTELAQKTSEIASGSEVALEKINKATKTINEMNGAIFTSVQEQSIISETINKKMEQLTQYALSSRDKANETNTSGQHMLELASKLEKLVGKFQV